MWTEQMKIMVRGLVIFMATFLWFACESMEAEAVIVNRNVLPVMKMQRERNAGGEMVTEVLMGEPIRILHKDGQWLHVSLPWQKDKPQGANEYGEYRGWIRADSGSIVTNKWRMFPGDEWYVLVGRSTDNGVVTVYLDERGQKPTFRSIGIVLPVVKKQIANSDFLVLRAPDDSLLYVPRNSLVAWGALSKDDFRDAVAVYASRLIGKPYVWGGNSGQGVDCSGLVYLAARCAGRLVPRDTFPQYEYFEKINRQDLNTGDLVYYQTYTAGASHVAIVLSGQGKIVHASKYVKFGMLDDSQLRSIEFGYRRIKW